MDYLNTQCLLCESNEFAVEKFPQNFKDAELTKEIFSARRTTEHFHYRFLECRKCGMVYSSPVLPLEVISRLYAESAQNYDDEVNDISESYLQYIRTNRDILKTGKVLEIGCGSGFFLRELKRNGFQEVYGVEPSEEAVSKSGELRPYIFKGIIEKADYSDDSFDLICCFQTLDHLINPLQVLQRSFELLKPGGIIYIIVHNQQGRQAKWFGEKSPIYDVEHIYLFNESTLPALCHKAGFQTLSIFSVKNIYPLDYWVRMAPIPMKSVLRKLLSLTGLSRRKLGIYPGNIGIFAQKPLNQ